MSANVSVIQEQIYLKVILIGKHLFHKTDEISKATEIVYEDYDKGYLEQIKDFKNYPLMLKHTVLLMLT